MTVSSLISDTNESCVDSSMMLMTLVDVLCYFWQLHPLRCLAWSTYVAHKLIEQLFHQRRCIHTALISHSADLLPRPLLTPLPPLCPPPGHAALTLRSRLRCIVLRKDSDTKQKPPTNLLVLNEVVVDRGPSPYLSNIDLYLDGKKITSVQGDGE